MVSTRYSTRFSILALLLCLATACSAMADSLHRKSLLVPVDLKESTDQQHTVYQNPQNQGLFDGFKRATEPLTRAGQDLTRASQQTLTDLGNGTRGAAQGAYNGVRDTLQAGGNALGQTVDNTLNLGNQQYFDERQNQLRQPAVQDPNLNRANGQPYAEPGARPTWQTQTQPASPQLPNPAYAPQNQTRPQDTGIATPFGEQREPAQQPAFNNQTPYAGTPGFQDNTFRNEARSQVVPVQNRGGLIDPPGATEYTRPYAAQQQAPVSTPAWLKQTTQQQPAAPATSAWGTPQFGNVPATNPSTLPVSQQQSPANTDSDVRSWGDGTAAVSTRAPVQQAAGLGTTGLPSRDHLLPLVLLCLSLAANFYVWTTYLDVRNKYRAALRRQPSGMHPMVA